MYRALLRTYHDIIRQQITRHNGLEVKAIGDGFTIVFYSARRAVACAVDLQLAVHEFNQQNSDRHLKVRTEINAWETSKEEEDFFGTAVALATRIMAQASAADCSASCTLLYPAKSLSSTAQQATGKLVCWLSLEAASDEAPSSQSNWF